MDEFRERVNQSLSISKEMMDDRKIVKSPPQEIDYGFLTDGRFFPKNLKPSFENTKFEESISFEIQNTVVHLIIRSDTKENHIKFFMDYICLCIGILADVFKEKINEITIILALLNKPRSKLPKENKHLSAEHINSGLTLTYPQRPPIIFIYRQKEVCKVILHELLHAYHIHPFQYPKKFDEKLINKYKINLHEVETLNIFEAYVEFIAILINSFIYEYKFKTTNALQKEILQQFHTVKQLQMYKPYSESTNIFAYVFLKTYLIMNMNDVLNKTKDDDYCIHDIDTIFPQKRMRFKNTKKQSFTSRITLNVMDIFKTYLKLAPL
jgi:hypothetical protein